MLDGPMVEIVFRRSIAGMNMGARIVGRGSLINLSASKGPRGFARQSLFEVGQHQVECYKACPRHILLPTRGSRAIFAS